MTSAPTFTTFDEYREHCDVLARGVDQRALDRVREVLAAAVLRDACIYTLGNGGFSTVAEHLALGLSLNVLREQGGGNARAFCLSASGAFTTAAYNDFGGRHLLAAAVRALGRPGDVLFALSGSGTSDDIVAALDQANDLDMVTLSVVGRHGAVTERSDVSIVLGTDSNAAAEDVGIMVLHWVYGQFMAGQRY